MVSLFSGLGATFDSQNAKNGTPRLALKHDGFTCHIASSISCS